MGNGATELGLPIGKCEEAARRRKAKRLVLHFGKAAQNMVFIGAASPDRHAGVKAEYKRTRNNLLAFMGV